MRSNRQVGTLSFLWLVIAGTLGAECRSAVAEAGIVSNPNRPSVSNPADITQYGLAEVEYGWMRTWPGAGNRSDLFGGLFRLGMLCDLELRFSADNFLSDWNGGDRRRGMGDTWAGMQYRFVRQSARLPSMAVSYALKQPTASAREELGSGRRDHFLTYLASKDFGGFHADFNAAYLLAGRSTEPGRDRNVQLALAVSRALRGPLGLTGEVYSSSRLNDENPAYGGTLWAASYTVNRRLTLDAALDVGLTSGAPRKRVLAGATLALGRVYR